MQCMCVCSYFILTYDLPDGGHVQWSKDVAVRHWRVLCRLCDLLCLHCLFSTMGMCQVMKKIKSHIETWMNLRFFFWKWLGKGWEGWSCRFGQYFWLAGILTFWIGRSYSTWATKQPTNEPRNQTYFCTLCIRGEQKNLQPNLQKVLLYHNTTKRCFMDIGILKHDFWVTASKQLKKMFKMPTLSFNEECCTSKQWPPDSLENFRFHMYHLKLACLWCCNSWASLML